MQDRNRAGTYINLTNSIYSYGISHYIFYFSSSAKLSKFIKDFNKNKKNISYRFLKPFLSENGYDLLIGLLTYRKVKMNNYCIKDLKLKKVYKNSFSISLMLKGC